MAQFTKPFLFPHFSFSALKLFGSEEFEINERVNSVYRGSSGLKLFPKGSNGRMLSPDPRRGVIIDDTVGGDQSPCRRKNQLTCRFMTGRRSQQIYGCRCHDRLRLRLGDRPKKAPLYKLQSSETGPGRCRRPCLRVVRPVSQSVPGELFPTLP